MSELQPLVGSPTKRFFVEMLPRDIELDDAILDLVDNSVDGAMRRAIRENTPAEHRYLDMWCQIEMDGEHFRIDDNCGGIPDTHFDAAFQLGRPLIDLDDNVPTIGVYGIGMKRAIFKMGRSGVVESRFHSHRRRVGYPVGWFENEGWELDVSEIEQDERPEGVTITVENLLPDVAARFRQEAAVNELRSKLGRHFAYIMLLGFRISLNGVDVSPQNVALKSETDGNIVPFAYSATIGEVEVNVSIGIFRRLAKESEIQDETDVEKARSVREHGASQTAGVTVICNDRVVLTADTSAITGWGAISTHTLHSTSQPATRR